MPPTAHTYAMLWDGTIFIGKFGHEECLGGDFHWKGHTFEVSYFGRGLGLRAMRKFMALLSRKRGLTRQSFCYMQPQEQELCTAYNLVLKLPCFYYSVYIRKQTDKHVGDLGTYQAGTCPTHTGAIRCRSASLAFLCQVPLFSICTGL